MLEATPLTLIRAELSATRPLRSFTNVERLARRVA